MTLPTFTLRQLVEAGVHFGHHARRWNPQMAPYIYGKKTTFTSSTCRKLTRCFTQRWQLPAT